MLGDELVARGRVGDDRRAVHGQLPGGGLARPEVLTDLHAERECAAVEHGGFAHRYRAVEDAGNCVGHGVAGGEPARLVELTVVGQVLLGHDAHVPAADDGGAVVELTADFQRQPDDERRPDRQRGKAGKRGLGGGEQRGLEEQVGAGVPGQAQLREYAKLRAAGIGLGKQRTNLADIGLRVGKMHPGHGGHDANHGQSSFRRRKSRVSCLYFTTSRRKLQTSSRGRRKK